MLLLAAVALASASAPTTEVKARATVRVERAVRVTGDDWKRLPEAKRREVLVRDEQGRPVLLRLIENE